MAGDIPLNEQLIIVTPTPAGAVLAPLAEAEAGGRILHVYGDRVRIAEFGIGEQAAAPLAAGAAAAEAAQEQLTETEALGVSAFQLRVSSEYQQIKANRPRQGEPWNIPEGGCTAVATPGEGAAALAEAPAGPTSAYLEGTIAVGIIMVSGPTAALTLSAAERTKVVAEVQNGLSYYAATDPKAGLTFVYDIHHVTLATPANPGAADLEGLWRDPAMAALGYSASWSAVGQYVQDIRQGFQTRWTYCAFFTKYPVGHFAYASIGGPRLVMHYDNDGWGPDNIDRVFAHESGHIFGCPDEYASSGCNCGGNWGRWGKPNTNCANCAPGGGIACLMKQNDWAICPVTPAHLGWVGPRFISKHSNRALDIAGISLDDGAKLQQWEYWGGENQIIRPDRLDDGSYRLVVQHSGKVLDVSGGSADDGAQIIQWPWHGGDNQRFFIEPLGDGFVRVVAKHSGKVLDVTGGSADNGALIIQWPWHGGNNQRWLAIAPIESKHSGKVLDIVGASTDDGAKLQQWDYHGGGNQILRPEALGDGSYRLVVQHSGKVLDVTGGSTDDGAVIQQWPWHGGDNQRFLIEPLGDGYVRVVAKHSGKVLDVTGGSTDSGALIIQWPWHGGNNQRWLVPNW